MAIHMTINCVHTIDLIPSRWSVGCLNIKENGDSMGLFLEGPKMIGKSTLLRQQLLIGNYHVGGFYVQRLLSETDEVMGFQLRAVNLLLPLTSSYHWSEDHCFLRRKDGQMVADLAVFEEFGQQLLEQALNQSYDVVLLDEIGGLELQVKGFYRSLTQLLKSTKKIVGVYKSAENYQELAHQQQLQIAPQRFQLERLMVTRVTVGQNLDSVQRQVADYLCESS